MALTAQTNTSLAEIADVLSGVDDVVICGHISPDGDCLGSQLALAHTLRSLGKNATCVLVKDEPVSQSLVFMPGIGDMIPASDYTGPVGAFVGVDVPSRSRVGEDACVLLDKAPVSVTIDHHAFDTPMCDLVYVDADCASASMLVWEVCKHLSEIPSVDCATCAYTGLVTDTGGFRFQNSDVAAFTAAADMVLHGADPASVATNVFQSRSYASLSLESLVVSRMRVLCEGQLVIGWVTKGEMDAVGAQKPDCEDIVDTLRSLGGARIICFLRDQDGVVRANLRAKDDTDVSALARDLGGGGHRAAAGLTLGMPMDEALELMESRLVQLVLSDSSDLGDAR